MMEIRLTRGLVAIVDDADYPLVLAQGKWHAHGEGRHYYAVRNMTRSSGRRKALAMHTFLTGWSLVDHVNGNGLDNRRENLRQASHLENMRNTRLRADNTSGFKGVSHRWHRAGWRAQIRVNGKIVHLGHFKSAIAAAESYNAAAIAYFGEFACINDIPRQGQES